MLKVYILVIDGYTEDSASIAICFAVLQQRNNTLLEQAIRYYTKLIHPKFYVYVPDMSINFETLQNNITRVHWRQVLLSGTNASTPNEYQIRQQGQFLANNDCLHRFRQHKWMLFVDPDDWLRLNRPFKQLEHKYSEACNIIFPWIHYNVSSVDPKKIALKSSIISSNQAWGAATKNMVRTKHALSVSIHSTDTCIHGKRVYARRKDAHVAHLRFPKSDDLLISQRGNP